MNNYVIERADTFESSLLEIAFINIKAENPLLLSGG